MRLNPIPALKSLGVRLKAKLGWAGIAILALSALSASLALALSLLLWLPCWTEGRLKSMLSEISGSGQASCEVRRIGLYGADLGPLTLGPKERPAVSFQSCSLDYSPLSLLRRRIGKVTLSGFEANCEYSDGRLKLPGLDLKASPGGSANSKPKPFAPPVSVGLIELKGGTLNFECQGTAVSMPFELSAAAERPDWSAALLKGSFLPGGQRLEIEARLDARLGNVSARAWTPKPLLIGALPCPKGAFETEPSGLLSIDACATAEEWGAKIKSIAADAEFERLSVNSGALAIGHALKDPLKISFRHEGAKGKLEVSSVALTGALDAGIEKASLDYEASSGGVNGAFNVSMRSGEDAIPSKLAGTFKASRAKEWRLEASATGEGPQGPFEFEWKGWRVSSLKPSLQLLASFGESVDWDASVKLPQLKASSGCVRTATKELSLAARSGKPGGLSCDLLLDSTEISAATLSAKLPKVSFSGSWKGGVFEGALQASNGMARESGSGCSLEGLEMDIPVRLPAEKVVEGEISVKSIAFGGKPAGKAAAKTSLSSGAFSVKGGASLSALPGMKIEFSSESRLGQRGLESESRLSIPACKIAEPADLGAFSPAAKDIRFTGEILLDASFGMNWKGKSGRLLFKVSGAKLESPEKGLLMDGAELSFEMPSLPSLESLPGQSASFKELRQGSLCFSDGSILFRMDSPKDWLVEKCSVKWCHGKLHTESIKLSPGSSDMDIVLNCDRLRLGEFLSQFGVGKAEGEGAISGTIPLSFKNGSVSFNDGFLYSTPGETSTLKLTNTESLTSGLSENSPLQAQLDMTRMALEDFIYSWAKVHLDTKGETFSLKLQMDGKPAAPLPFEHNKETGYFVRVAGPGSRFQGIRLDVNFNLPLSQILGLGKEIRKLMDKTGNR